MGPRMKDRDMDKTSPYYLFDPDSIGWLKRLHEKDESVSKADVIRLLEADPDHANDPLLQQYVLKALKGELKGKPGRQTTSIVQGVRFLMAQDEYERLLARINGRRKNVKGARTKYPNELSIRLADAVARKWRLRCSGRSFLNRISLTKKHGRLW